MRIDSINLIGDFFVRGNTGSSGQVLGITGEVQLQICELAIL